MIKNKIITITEARGKIYDISEELNTTSLTYTLTKNGHPSIVMMSFDEYESWMETLEVYRTFPNILETIKKAKKQFENGEYIDLRDIVYNEKTTPSKQFLLKDKNAIQGKINKRSGKISKKSSNKRSK